MSEPTPKRSRMRKARKYALDILYSADLTGSSVADAMATYATMSDHAIPAYSRTLAEGVAAHDYLIDGYLAPCLNENWTIERMPAIDRCLARMAVYEMLYADLPPAIAISEAVSLAEELSTDSSPTFLTGVLGHVATLIPQPGDQGETPATTVGTAEAAPGDATEESESEDSASEDSEGEAVAEEEVYLDEYAPDGNDDNPEDAQAARAEQGEQTPVRQGEPDEQTTVRQVDPDEEATGDATAMTEVYLDEYAPDEDASIEDASIEDEYIVEEDDNYGDHVPVWDTPGEDPELERTGVPQIIQTR